MKTIEYQKLVCKSYNLYFDKVIPTVPESDIQDLFDQYSKLAKGHGYKEKRKILSAISESKTKYRLSDYHMSADRDLIYSPRVDVAFTPILGDRKNLAFYPLNDNPDFMRNVYEKLSFIGNMVYYLKSYSNRNLSDLKLDNEDNHLSRPMYIWGIEIERQHGKKYLLGDIINATSLSIVPIVLIPESNLLEVKSVIAYCKFLRNIKDVDLYSHVSKCLFITDKQFSEISNRLFSIDSTIPPIPEKLD